MNATNIPLLLGELPKRYRPRATREGVSVDEDSLSTARGILIGIPLGAVLWVALVWAVSTFF